MYVSCCFVNSLAVDDEMLKPLLEEKTIKQTIAGKRLFIVDLAILEGVPAKTSELVVSPEHYILKNIPVHTRKKSLKIPKGLSDFLDRRMKDNTKAKR